jgi:DMSO/TMAO reductase YedYZ molybdopterin-dependent catalytic subunit
MKAIALVLLVGIVIISGCVSEPIELDAVEIEEYQGERLGSVDDFRENSIKGVQYVNIDNYTLELKGLVEETANLSYDQVLSHQSYEKVVTLHCVEGWSVKILWEGVLIKDLLGGVKPLDSANTVIFHAYDGYTSSLPLDYILDNNILLAYRMNGATIPPERGFPFQVVAENKLGYKWVKWLTGIELSDDPNYLGYWERRGYSNQADI